MPLVDNTNILGKLYWGRSGVRRWGQVTALWHRRTQTDPAGLGKRVRLQLVRGVSTLRVQPFHVRTVGTKWPLASVSSKYLVVNGIGLPIQFLHVTPRRSSFVCCHDATCWQRHSFHVEENRSRHTTQRVLVPFGYALSCETQAVILLIRSCDSRPTQKSLDSRYERWPSLQRAARAFHMVSPEVMPDVTSTK